LLALVGAVDHDDARPARLAVALHRARDESERELLGRQRRLRRGDLVVEAHLDPDAADARQIAVLQDARGQRAELDAPHESAVRAPLVDQDVLAPALANGRMPMADARIGEPDLGALAAPDDDRGRLEGERKSRLLRLRSRTN